MQQASQAVADITPQAELQFPATFAETFYFSYVCLTDLIARVEALEARVEEVESSVTFTCAVLDDLLDTAAAPRDCCINGVSLVCLLRSIMIIDSTTDPGVCLACPAIVFP